MSALNAAYVLTDRYYGTTVNIYLETEHEHYILLSDVVNQIDPRYLVSP
jgi:hypothetical protein